MAEPTLIGWVIAAWPSFALMVSYELLTRQGAPRRGWHGCAGPTAAPAAAAKPATGGRGSAPGLRVVGPSRPPGATSPSVVSCKGRRGNGHSPTGPKTDFAQRRGACLCPRPTGALGPARQERWPDGCLQRARAKAAKGKAVQVLRPDLAGPPVVGCPIGQRDQILLDLYAA